MAFDIANAKTRLGLPTLDTSKDALITSALATVLAVVETYLNRRLMWAAQLDELVATQGDSILVDRYPIDRVISLTLGGRVVDPASYAAQGQAGVIRLSSQHAAFKGTLSYEGGYKVLPLDLEAALWMLFDGYWPSISGAGATVVGAGEISSITIPDVGTVRFSEGVQTGSSGGSAIGMLSDPFTILALYRRIVV